MTYRRQNPEYTDSKCRRAKPEIVHCSVSSQPLNCSHLTQSQVCFDHSNHQKVINTTDRMPGRDKYCLLPGGRCFLPLETLNLSNSLLTLANYKSPTAKWEAGEKTQNEDLKDLRFFWTPVSAGLRMSGSYYTAAYLLPWVTGMLTRTSGSWTPKIYLWHDVWVVHDSSWSWTIYGIISHELL